MLIPLETLIRAHGIRPTGVLHLGAHLCEEAKDYHKARAGKVWWVEALPDLAEQCEQKLVRYPEQQVINACVGAIDGEAVTFHRANNGMSSSTLELGTHLDVAPDVSYVEDVEMTSTTVDTLVKTHRIRADFCNADLQGGEGLAFRGAERFLTEQVKFIYCELNWRPLYKGCVLLPELDRQLGELGFERFDTVMAGNSGWGDGLFCKPSALGL